MENEALEDLYYDLVKFTAGEVGKGKTGMEVAAVMTRVALQIYKTSLSEDDFNRMVDFISSSRDEISPFQLDIPLQ